MSQSPTTWALGLLRYSTFNLRTQRTGPRVEGSASSAWPLIGDRCFRRWERVEGKSTIRPAQYADPGIPSALWMRRAATHVARLVTKTVDFFDGTVDFMSSWHSL